MEDEWRKLGDALRDHDRLAGHSAPPRVCSMPESSCHLVAEGSTVTWGVAWSCSQGAHRAQVKLPWHGGVTPLEPYLAQLQLAARYSRWEDEEAAVHLAMALEGPMAQVLLDLPPSGPWHL